MKRDRMEWDEDAMDVDEEENDMDYESLYGKKERAAPGTVLLLPEKDMKTIQKNIPAIEESVEMARKFCDMFTTTDVFVRLTNNISVEVLDYFLSQIDIMKPRITGKLFELACQKVFIFQKVEKCFQEYKDGYELDWFYNQCFLESCFPEGAPEIFEYLITKVYPSDRFELAMKVCLENLEHAKAVRIKSDARYNREWPQLNPHRERFSAIGEQILMS